MLHASDVVTLHRSCLLQVDFIGRQTAAKPFFLYLPFRASTAHRARDLHSRSRAAPCPPAEGLTVDPRASQTDEGYHRNRAQYKCSPV